MANWSKRTTKKHGNSRFTKTTNQKGGSTNSSSFSAGKGAPRITNSIKSSNNKVRQVVYTTEYHPTLGTKRTQRTIYSSSSAKPKKPKKTRTKQYKSSSQYTGVDFNFPNIFKLPYIGWITTACLLLLFGAAWYIWLIYISAFLKFKVDFFK